MALGSRYTVLTQVMDDGRLIRSTDADPTVVLTPEQASALIALGAISPVPVGSDQVNEAVGGDDLTAIVYDGAGDVLSYVQGGVPHAVARDGSGRVISVAAGDRVTTVSYDDAGRVLRMLTV